MSLWVILKKWAAGSFVRRVPSPRALARAAVREDKAKGGTRNNKVEEPRCNILSQ